MKIVIIVPPALNTADYPADMFLKGEGLDRLNKNIKYDMFDLNFIYLHNKRMHEKFSSPLLLFINSDKKFEKRILNYCLYNYGKDPIINYLVNLFIGNINFFAYDLIAIAALEFEQVKLGLCFAKYIKEISKKPLVFGNISDDMLYIPYRISHLIEQFDFIDCLIDKTRGYDIFLNFLNNYNKKKFNKVQGLIYRSGNSIVYNEGYHRENKSIFSYNINRINLTFSNIYKKVMMNYKSLFYELGRGCNNSCFFCEVNYFPSSMKHPRRIIDDIEKLIREYDVRNFALGCSSINHDRLWLNQFLNEIKKRKVVFFWTTLAIPSGLDFLTLRKMADCGCINLHFGFESWSNSRFKMLSKSIKTDEIKNIIYNCNKVGIYVRPLFIVGFPHESKEEVDRIKYFIKKYHKRFSSIDIHAFRLLQFSPLNCNKDEIKKLRIIPRKPDIFSLNYIPYDEVKGMSWEEKSKDNLSKINYLFSLCDELGIMRGPIGFLDVFEKVPPPAVQRFKKIRTDS